MIRNPLIRNALDVFTKVPTPLRKPESNKWSKITAAFWLFALLLFGRDIDSFLAKKWGANALMSVMIL